MTRLLSNNDSVQAVAETWQAMVTVTKQYQHTGRGFLYSGDSALTFDYIGLDHLQTPECQQYLDIGSEQYDQLIDAIANIYNPEIEFVFVTRAPGKHDYEFKVCIGSLADNGWEAFNTREHIKAVDKSRQLYANKMTQLLYKVQRPQTKSKRKKRK